MGRVLYRSCYNVIPHWRILEAMVTLPESVREYDRYASVLEAEYAPFFGYGSRLVLLALEGWSGNIVWYSGIFSTDYDMVIPVDLMGQAKYIHLEFIFQKDDGRTYRDTLKVRVGLPLAQASEATYEMVRREYKQPIHRIRQRARKFLSERPRGKPWRSSSEVRPNEGKTEAFPWVEVVNNGIGGGDITYPHSDHVRTTYSRTWTGGRTPNFARLREEGRLPVNPHLVNWKRETDGLLSTYDTWKTLPSYFAFNGSHMSRVYPVPIVTGHLSGVADKALSNLVKRVGGIEANLAQDVVQYRQTVKLIAETAKGLAGAITSLRQGDILGATKSLGISLKDGRKMTARAQNAQSLASKWLALQYGWKPLLKDVHESIQLIAKWNQEGGPGVIRRVTASSSKSSDAMTAFDVSGYPGVPGGFYSTVKRTRVKYMIRYRQSSRVTSYLAQTGFTNLPNLAWEVLPYSFVVDWFLPIGPWLETLSAWDGLEFEDGSVTSFSRGYGYTRVSYDADVPNTLLHVRGRGQYSSETVTLNRERINTFPMKQNLPSLKNPFSVTHALNAMALMVVGFKKGARVRD